MTTHPQLNHGAIGNGRVIALVSPSSAIDWLCLPRFDSPSVFGRLLDHDKGGTFRVLAGDREIAGQMSYIRNTNVLKTVFEDGDSSWEIIDFAPRILRGYDVDVPVEITRLVRPLRGTPRIGIDFDPRPDYARAEVRLEPNGNTLEVIGGAGAMRLSTNAPIPYLLDKRTFVLREPLFFTLSYGTASPLKTLSDLNRELEQTIAGWRQWAITLALPTFAAEAVLRSALCLKLHAYHDTGAIIAAATTSIPEAMGTERTWDYRFCWLRDSAFVVEALRRLGHLAEGEQFIHFLRDVAECGPLQPLYGIGGERDLTESFLPHLAGFGGNGHVRIGNAASIQQQNDVPGELMLCLETLLSDPRASGNDVQSFIPLVVRLVEEAIRIAPEPDTGIWEFRTLMRPYTFSRAMCWAAIQRGAIFAKRLGLEQASRWSQIADEERAIILERGYNAKLGFFTQALDGEHADASLLLLPTIGLLDANDPRFVSTVKKYGEVLTHNGLMLRYKNADDFGVTTSSITICSFWWVEALALSGALDEAVTLFERLMKFANPVGLFSEDVEPGTGELLGNFPQAYTHVGLVHAAMTLSELLEVRDGRVRAWT